MKLPSSRFWRLAFAIAVVASMVAQLDGCASRPTVEQSDAGPAAQLRSLPLRLDVSEQGVAVARGEGRALHVRAHSLGRGGASGARLGPVRPILAGGRASYPREGIVEWYEATAKGVEQGFTVESAPPGLGPLQIDVEVGDFEAAPSPIPNSREHSTSLDLRLLYGAEAFGYGELAVTDSAGRSLEATLIARPDHVARIEIDDRGAVYPILVDPLIWAVSDTLVESIPTPGEGFGYSTAVRGDTIIASAPFRDGGGGATVFDRDAGTWSQSTRLEIPDAGVSPDAVLHFGTVVGFDGVRAIVGSEGPQLLYARDAGVWSFEQAITPPWLPYPGQGFAVDILGNRAAILLALGYAAIGNDGGLSYFDTTNQPPPVGVFIYERGASGKWLLVKVLTPPVAANTAVTGQVILQDDRVVIAVAGSVVVYTRAPSATWTLEAVIRPTAGQSAFLGYAIAAAGTTLLVSDSIQVFAYERNGTTWRLVSSLLVASAPTVASCFGCAMATNGESAFVQDTAYFPPLVYRYRHTGDLWVLEETLPPPGGYAPATSAPRQGISMTSNTATIGHFQANGGRGAVIVATLARTQGARCDFGTECASGFCADQTCCDTECATGTGERCVSCSRAGSVGTCSPAEPLTVCRPAVGSCDVADTCDGEHTQCPADLQKANNVGCENGGSCKNGVCLAPLVADGSVLPSQDSAPESAPSGCSASHQAIPRDGSWAAAVLAGLCMIVAWRRKTPAVALLAVLVAIVGLWQREQPRTEIHVASRDGSLLARFDRDGARLVDEAGKTLWATSMIEYGRATRMQPVSASSPLSENDRVVYNREGLVEWYKAKADSIEQGFDFAARPEGAGPLLIRMRRTLSSSIRYGKLSTVDANGAQIACTLSTNGEIMEIRIDDSAATYPIVVDPSIWRERQTFVPAAPRLDVFDAVDSTLAFRHAGSPPAAVEVFRKSGATWNKESDLVPFADFEDSHDFGTSVTTSASTIAVGAYFYSLGSLASANGGVFIFDRSALGSWSQTQVLVPADLTTRAWFGCRTALNGNVLAVGATQQGRFIGTDDGITDPTRSIGAAYMYKRSAAGPWTLASKITLPASLLFLGQSLGWTDASTLAALVNDRTSGAPLLLFFQSIGTSWQVTDGLEFPINYSAVTVVGDTAVFGGPTMSVYRRSATGWTPEADLVTDDAEANTLGFPVLAISGSRLVAASPAAESGKGVIFVFDRDANNKWSQTARLTASDGVANDNFGAQIIMPNAGEFFVAAYGHGASGKLYDFQLGADVLKCTPATVAADCATNEFCVDGFCCNSACGGDNTDDCQACSVAAGAAKDGTCGPVTPRVCRAARNECDVEDRCDGTRLECPADLQVEDGRACTNGFCAEGACRALESVSSNDGGVPSDNSPLPADDGSCSCRTGAGSTTARGGGAFALGAFAIFLAALRRRGSSARAVGIAACFVLFILGWGRAASAQEEGQSDNTSAALAKFDEGRKALEANDFATALAAFETSNKLLGSPNSVLYMGRCYLGLGKTASAYTSFRLAYRQAQDRLVATADKRYAGTRDSAAREAATIEADVPKLAIAVPEDAPSSVVVTRNGITVPRSSWGSAIDTDPGHVVVDVVGARLQPFHEELDLPIGETRRVDVQLKHVPTAILRVHFDSRPVGLALRLDGTPVEPSELTAPREVDPGPRIVEVTAPGHIPFRWQGSLTNGETKDVAVHLVEQRTEARVHRATTPQWLFWTTAGVAAGALGTATVIGTHASIRAGNQTDEDALLRTSSTRDSIRSEATVANVFFVMGAVVATGAVILAFTTDWHGRGSGSVAASATVVDAFTSGSRF